MAKTELLLQDGSTDFVKYAHTSAVTAGDIIQIAGIGAGRASDSYAANATGVYQIKGVIYADIASSVTVAQGDVLWWDNSLSAVRKRDSTTTGAADFPLGIAKAAGTATAGKVEVYLNAASDIIAEGKATTSNNSTQTIPVYGMVTGDDCQIHICSMGAATVLLNTYTPQLDGISVTFSGAPSTDHGVYYRVRRSRVTI